MKSSFDDEEQWRILGSESAQNVHNRSLVRSGVFNPAARLADRVVVVPFLLHALARCVPLAGPLS